MASKPNVEQDIKTGPYKWTRDLYEKLAKHHGCEHRFAFEKSKVNNVRKTAYKQVISGPDDKVALVEREAESAREHIEAETRLRFPGPKMFTKPANEHREKMVREMQP